MVLENWKADIVISRPVLQVNYVSDYFTMKKHANTIKIYQLV